MAAGKVARLTLVIDGSPGGGIRAVDQMQKELVKLDQQTDRTGRRATVMRTAFAGLNRETIAMARNLAGGALGVTGIAAALGSSVGAAKDFEKSISNLSAITGATGKDLDFYRDVAQDMGRTTTLAATEVVEAIKLVASAKPDLLDNAQALQSVTREAITLAEAASITVPAAAAALGNSLNQFGADADEASRFISVLAAGAAFGASEIEDTTAALKASGVAASTLGVPFEELNANIQTLAEKGIKGSEAGTALRNVLLTLADGPDKTNPQIVGFTNALQELENQQLSVAQASQLFGKENVTAALALVNAADATELLTGRLRGTDEAYRQAQANVDNLAGDISQFKSAAEGLQIAIGLKGQAEARDAVQALTGLVNGLTDNLDKLDDVAIGVGVVLAARFVPRLYESTAALAAKTVASVAAAKQEAVLAAATNAQAAADLRAAKAAAARVPGFYLNANAMAALTAAETNAAAAANAYSAAQARATLAARAGAVAYRSLGGAMALVGGPVGAAILAVGAGVLALRNRSMEAAEEQERLAEAIRISKEAANELAQVDFANLKGLSEGLLRQNVESANQRLDALLTQVVSVQDEIANLERKRDQSLAPRQSVLGFNPVVFSPADAQRLAALRTELQGLQFDAESNEDALSQLIAALNNMAGAAAVAAQSSGAITARTEEELAAIEKLVGGLRVQRDALLSNKDVREEALRFRLEGMKATEQEIAQAVSLYREITLTTQARRDAAEQARELQTVLDVALPGEAALRSYAEQTQVLRDAFQSGAINAATYDAAIQSLTKTLQGVGVGPVREIEDALSGLTLGDNLGEGFDQMSRSIVDAIGALDELARAQDEFGKLRKEFAGDDSALAQIAEREKRAQIGLYGDLSASAKGFFDEGTTGYKALQAVEQGFRAAEIAMAATNLATKLGLISTETTAVVTAAGTKAAAEGTASVASAGVGIPFPYNIAAILATIGILSANGVDIGGGGGGAPSGALDVSGKQSKNFGGTVLGDASAQSESITNAIGQLEDISTVGLEYSEQMAASLRNIEMSLAGVASEFARVAGAEGVQQFGISGTFGNFNAGLSEVVAGRTVTSGASTRDLARMARELSPSDSTAAAAFLAEFQEAQRRLTEAAGDPETVQAMDRITSLVSQTFDGIETSMIDAIEILGGNTKAAAFLLGQEIVDLNLLEQADLDTAITALFSGIADSAAGIADNVLADIDLTQYQLVGEGLFETLVRVASGFEVVSTELGRIGLSLDGIDVEASENLIALFGGIDEFVSAQQDYIEAMYSDAEKLAIQQADLSRVFDSLGTAIPENVEAYRALVEAQNRNTESGRAMYAALVQAAPLFGDVQDALEDAAKAAADFAADMADMASSLRRAQVGLAGGSVAAFDLGRLANQINAATTIEELVGLIPALQTALNAQYQEGIDGINAQTRAQQEANRAWLDGVTETANAAMDAQLEAINATKDAQLAAIDTQLDGLREQIQLGEAMRDQAQNLREFVEGIVRGQSQAQAQQGLTALITAARGGDLEAAGQITGAASTAIDFARANATSRVEFDREQNRILQQLTGAADVLGIADVPTQQLQALEDSRAILEAGFDAQLEAAREQTDALLAGYQATAEAMNAQAEAYGQQQAEWLAQQLSGSFDFLLSALDEAQAGGDLDTIKADLIAAIGGTTQAVLQLQALQQLSDSNVTGVLDFMTRAVQDIAADGILNNTQGFDQVVSALYGLEQTTLLSTDTSVQAVDYLNNALTDVLDDGFLNQTQGFADVAALLHLVNSTTALEASQGRAAIGVLEAALTDVIADGTLDTFSGLQGVINALAANGVDINALQSATQSGLGNVANTTASWLSLVNSTTGNGSNVVADYISNLIGTTDNGIGSTLSHLAWVAQNEGQTTHSVNAVYNQMAELLVQLRDSVGPRGASQNLLSINENMRQQMEETKNRLHTSGPAGGIGARIEYVRANASSIVEALNQAYGTSATRYAKGGVFTNQVVTSPTQFQLGLMGEAGPEAIMPLTRGPDGALGVQNFGDANRVLVAEVRALRAEVAQLRASNEQGQDIQIRELQIHNKRERRYDGGTHKKVGTDVSSPVQVELVEEVPA